MPATTGMKGAGYYDQHSTTQLASIQALEDWVEAAVAKMPLPAPHQPVTILDLGSSEGRNAIRVMSTAIEALRRRTSQTVKTIYSDLASNNFNQLFANLEEAGRAGLFSTGIFAGAIGGSFYGPLMPAGSVHLATSFNSIQWLDQLPPVSLSDRIAYRRPDPDRLDVAVSAEVVAGFQKQADHDLVRFLECRARELAPGGKLFLAQPGDSGQISIADGIEDLLSGACLDLVDAEHLEQKDYERLTMPVYFRTVEELLAPLERKDSKVSGLFAVERAEALEVPTPFIVEFQLSGDIENYADSYTGFLRAISEPVVKSTFGQSESGATAVDLLYDRIHERLLVDPERYFFRYIMVAALLTRR
jgi:hypothetical protein